MARHADDSPADPADVELVIRRLQGDKLVGDDFQRVVKMTETDFSKELLGAVTSPWGMDLARELAAGFFQNAHGMFGRKHELEAGAELITGEPTIYWIAQIVHSKQRTHFGVGDSITSDVRHNIEGIFLHDAHSHKRRAALDPKHLPGGFGHSWGVVWGKTEPGEVVVIANPTRRSAACTSVISVEESGHTHAHWTTPS